ncbi:MAG: nucleoside triphosphate pyrophosphohydrolase [Bacteroidetes bacterium]|nr:nucleoside triphosphate pyrophosphohydrolase [Bacteroidota bacterium]MBU1680970.1 nucleoside triphosphate pyrophosphohydrolase [Bacteroidota bacterium]MBU2506112.1 nucleoside triphosphate pyrophosphohydrolase [Bacteroidota bacterium]
MTGKKFNDLVEIMRKLRRECPWDAEQTHESIKSATLEEAYEVVESIDDKNLEELKSELGDLLLHIVFHSVIAEQDNNFTIDEVIDSIKDKLIRRHPHVFGNVEINSNKDITRNWEAIKLSEGRNSVVEGIPKNLPELHKAFRIQEKVSKVGFDWEDKKDVWKKVEEEIQEFKNAENSGNLSEMEKEAGDILFAFVNYYRFLGINAENALRKTNEKFTKRFGYIEEKLKLENISIIDASLTEMDKYWEESKKIF